MPNTEWSTPVSTIEHKEIQATHMAVDPAGSLAILAGRRLFCILSLKDPLSPQISLRGGPNSPMSKFDVKVVEWNPTSEHKNHIAVAAGNECEIHIMNRAGQVIPGSRLLAHTRAITDINWHNSIPHFLASASVEGGMYIWDVREPRRPTTTLPVASGATQIKWNKLVGHLLASGHETEIRIWDNRKPSIPLQSYRDHMNKISSIDWSPVNSEEFVSTSQDSVVHFFDLNFPRPIVTMHAKQPVWRASYTPFGRGILTVAAPQLLRSDNSLALWSISSQKKTVHRFTGLTDVVLSYGWRCKDEEGFQLVSWSRDKILNIWDIDKTIQDKIHPDGNINGDPLQLGDNAEFSTDDVEPLGGDSQVLQDMIAIGNGETQQQSESTAAARETAKATDAAAPSEGSSDSPSAASSASAALPSNSVESPSALGSLRELPPRMSAKEELTTLKTDGWSCHSSITYFDISTDLLKRQVLLFLATAQEKIGLTITLPPSYPLHARPKMKLSSTLDHFSKYKIISALARVVEEHFKKSLNSVTAIITTLLTCIQEINDDPSDFDEGDMLPEDETTADSQMSKVSLYGTSEDHAVPFPRTSGARFCGNDMLVCFTRPTYLTHKKKNCLTINQTPRSLSALGAYISNFNPAVTEVATHPHRNHRMSIQSGGANSRMAGGDSNRNLYPLHSRTLPEYNNYLNNGHADKTNTQGEATNEDVSISEYYYNKLAIKAGTVLVCNVEKLLPVSKILAMEYRLMGDDVIATCMHNQEVAIRAKRPDLAQVWSMAARIVSLPPGIQPKPTDNLGATFKFPWALHPLARPTILKILNHYLKLGDIQTTALLSCVFGGKSLQQQHPHEMFSQQQQQSSNPQQQQHRSSGYHQHYSHHQQQQQQHMSRRSAAKSTTTPQHLLLERLWRKTGGSPYNTIHGLNMKAEGVRETAPLVVRHNRSNSEGSLPESSRSNDGSGMNGNGAPPSSPSKTSVTGFLPSKESASMEDVRRMYCNILYNWQLLNQRTEVQQYSSQPHTLLRDAEFLSECGNCKQLLHSHHCPNCRKPAMYCSICQLPVRGLSLFCLWCGHGGHTQHLLQWFTNNRHCAIGCGCCCADYFSNRPPEASNSDSQTGETQ